MIPQGVRAQQFYRKIETLPRLFRWIDRFIAAGFTMDDVVNWQNRIKPHASLDYKVLETVFVERLSPERIFGYA